jgi:hypothetical protein
LRVGTWPVRVPGRTGSHRFANPGCDRACDTSCVLQCAGCTDYSAPTTMRLRFHNDAPLGSPWTSIGHMRWLLGSISTASLHLIPSHWSGKYRGAFARCLIDVEAQPRPDLNLLPSNGPAAPHAHPHAPSILSQGAIWGGDANISLWFLFGLSLLPLRSVQRIVFGCFYVGIYGSWGLYAVWIGQWRNSLVQSFVLIFQNFEKVRRCTTL